MFLDRQKALAGMLVKALCVFYMAVCGAFCAEEDREINKDPMVQEWQRALKKHNAVPGVEAVRVCARAARATLERARRSSHHFSWEAVKMAFDFIEIEERSADAFAHGKIYTPEDFFGVSVVALLQSKPCTSQERRLFQDSHIQDLLFQSLCSFDLPVDEASVESRLTSTLDCLKSLKDLGDFFDLVLPVYMNRRETWCELASKMPSSNPCVVKKCMHSLYCMAVRQKCGLLCLDESDNDPRCDDMGCAYFLSEPRLAFGKYEADEKESDYEDDQCGGIGNEEFLSDYEDDQCGGIGNEEFLSEPRLKAAVVSARSFPGFAAVEVLRSVAQETLNSFGGSLEAHCQWRADIDKALTFVEDDETAAFNFSSGFIFLPKHLHDGGRRISLQEWFLYTPFEVKLYEDAFVRDLLCKASYMHDASADKRSVLERLAPCVSKARSLEGLQDFVQKVLAAAEERKVAMKKLYSIVEGALGCGNESYVLVDKKSSAIIEERSCLEAVCALFDKKFQSGPEAQVFVEKELGGDSLVGAVMKCRGFVRQACEERMAQDSQREYALGMRGDGLGPVSKSLCALYCLHVQELSQKN